MSFFKMKEYIHKTENDDSFIKDEIQRFAKHLPRFANVVITERDEYITQSIYEVAKVGFSKISPSRSGKIVVVVGAGHLCGIKDCIAAGNIYLQYISVDSLLSRQIHIK